MKNQKGWDDDEKKFKKGVYFLIDVFKGTIFHLKMYFVEMYSVEAHSSASLVEYILYGRRTAVRLYNIWDEYIL